MLANHRFERTFSSTSRCRGLASRINLAVTTKLTRVESLQRVVLTKAALTIDETF